MLIDTHCHIQEPIELALADILANAQAADVLQMICVGTSEESSRQAISFANEYPAAFAAVGVHPHETNRGYSDISRLAGSSPKIVAVGEIGLDYFYNHSPKEIQIAALRAQIEVALAHNLPIIFHVRDAFDDFWPIFDDYKGVKGVLHSFTDSITTLQRAIDEGLYIGVNGISTFSKDHAQQAMFDAIPLDRFLLETDAPFLTPVPNRGKINQPAYVRLVAEFHAKRRNISLDELSAITSNNARSLFSLS